MQTECSANLLGFVPVEQRTVVAGFDGGRMTSDAGALLLGATDRAIGLVERFATCFTDSRSPELIEHEVKTLVGQRIFGIALGYEDLVDHDQLRHDPTMAVLAGKLAARRKDCAPLAGKSTLNRLELGGTELTRYHRIGWDAANIEALFVELFIEAHQEPPKRIILDLDATEIRAAGVVLVEHLVGVIERGLADVDADGVVFADYLWEPVGGLDRFERAVDVDLLHLVDRYDGRVAITGCVARRHGDREPLVRTIAKFFHDRARLGAIFRDIGIVSRQLGQPLGRQRLRLSHDRGPPQSEPKQSTFTPPSHFIDDGQTLCQSQ